MFGSQLWRIPAVFPSTVSSRYSKKIKTREKEGVLLSSETRVPMVKSMASTRWKGGYTVIHQGKPESVATKQGYYAS